MGEALTRHDETEPIHPLRMGNHCGLIGGNKYTTSYLK